MEPVLAEPLQAAAKAALFIGFVLLVGAGVFVRWIAGPALPARNRARLAWTGALGALLLTCGSVLEVVDAISRAAGAFDSSLVAPYLFETRHGNAVIARLVLALPLAIVAGAPRHRRVVDRAVFVPAALGLPLTLTFVSHAGAQGLPLPIVADFIHAAGVAAWAGSVLYAAWLLPWPRTPVAPADTQTTLHRLSTLGLVGLTAVVITGAYAAVVRLPDLGALTRTLYGRTLLVKMAAVSSVVMIAAVNRWVAVPWMTRGLTAAVLRRLVRVESLLVLVVLGVTAVLVSQPLPQLPVTAASTMPFDATAGPWRLHGSVTGGGTDGFSLEVRLEDERGAPAPDTVTVALELTMLDMVMQPLHGTLPRVAPGLYRGTYQLPMSGRWQLTVRAATGVATVTIPTHEVRVPPRPVAWNAVVAGVAAAAAGLWLATVGLRRLGAGVGRAAWPLWAGAVLAAAGATALIRALGR